MGAKKARRIWGPRCYLGIVIDPCRPLGVNPEAYLVDVFQRLATVDPKDGDAIRAQTPARWAAERQSAAA